MKYTKPTKINKNKLLKTRWLEVEQHEFTMSDKRYQYDIVVRSDCVIVVVIDEEQNLILVEQYRYPVNAVSLGFPMGGIDSGEAPLNAAKRELYEEVGLKGEQFDLIGKFNPVPGLSSQTAYVYTVKVEKIDESELSIIDTDEGIQRIKIIPLCNIKKFILNKLITDGYSISAAMYLLSI